MADIEIPAVPLPLVRPGGEFDNDHLLEQDAVDVLDNITQGENENNDHWSRMRWMYSILLRKRTKSIFRI
jgi:hypothetical protein